MNMFDRHMSWHHDRHMSWPVTGSTRFAKLIGVCSSESQFWSRGGGQRKQILCRLAQAGRTICNHTSHIFSLYHHMLRSRIPIIACHCRFAHWPEFKNELQPASQCVVFDGCPEDDISFKMDVEVSPLCMFFTWLVSLSLIVDLKLWIL